MPIKGHTDTVIHNWAHNAVIDHSNARKSEVVESNNCSRDCQGYLWSYSTRIAYRIDSNRYLVSSERYSNTTAKQLRQVWRSIPHRAASIEVPEIDHRYIESNPSSTLKRNVEYLCGQIIESAHQCWKYRNEVGGTTQEPKATSNQLRAQSSFDDAILALTNYLEWFPSGREFVTLPVKSKAAIAKLAPSRFFQEFDKAKALAKAKAVKAARETRQANIQEAKNYLDSFNRSELLGSLYETFKADASPTLPQLSELAKHGKGYSQLIKFSEVAYKICDHVKGVNPSLYSTLRDLVTIVRQSTSYEKLIAQLKTDNLYNYSPQDTYNVRRQLTDKLNHLATLLNWYSTATPEAKAEYVMPQFQSWEQFDNLPEAIATRQSLPVDAKVGDYPKADFEAYLCLLHGVLPAMNSFYRNEYDRQYEIRNRDLIERQRRENEEKKKQLAQSIQDWKDCKHNSRHQFYNLGILLRVNGDNVETSQGASVPVKLARYVWPKLLAYRQGLINSAQLPSQWGAYHLRPDAQPNDRSVLIIGCHRLEWSEINEIAAKLDLAWDTLDNSTETETTTYAPQS